MLRTFALLAGVTAILGAAANAEVKAKASDGMTLQISAEAKLDRDAAWARLLDLPAWWSPAHTYSGDAARLSLDAQAGGCWCEIWSGGEVEHGRVVMVMPRQTLRVSASLGPLQELGVSGAMTFTLSDGATPGTTKLTLHYKVVGSSLSGLDGLAVIVDQVLAEQVGRFAAAN